MFTIKLYDHNDKRKILSADSFTINADDARGFYEVSLHQASGDCRFDIGPANTERSPEWPPLYSHAFIVNENGRTIETLRHSPG